MILMLSPKHPYSAFPILRPCTEHGKETAMQHNTKRDTSMPLMTIQATPAGHRFTSGTPPLSALYR